MNPRFPTRPLMLLALLGGLLLGGCVTKPTVSTRYYILTSHTEQAAPTAQPGNTEGPVVEIAALTLPRYLERQQIVTRPSPQRLELHENHRWGDNLHRNLERVLASNLSHRLGAPQVVVVPHLLAEVDYRLLVDIQNFERVQGDQVVLRAQWTLLRPGQRKPLAVQTSQLSRALNPGAGMEQVVETMSGLFDELTAQIATAIDDR